MALTVAEEKLTFSIVNIAQSSIDELFPLSPSLILTEYDFQNSLIKFKSCLALLFKSLHQGDFNPREFILNLERSLLANMCVMRGYSSYSFII